MSLSDTVGCAHCDLPVAVGPEATDDDAPRFCCRGCATAYALIHDHGLQSYYRYAEERGTRAATGDDRLSYAELDRPAFLDAHTTEPQPGQREVLLGLEGIHCAACIWLLEKLPQVVPGVRSARVDWARATIRVRWSTTETTLSAIAEGIAGLGYRPHPQPAADRSATRAHEDRRRLIALGVAFAAAGNNMLIALSLYLGMFSSMEGPVETLLRWGSCLVGMVSLLGPGRVFFDGAIAALRTRTPHMDLPVALALAVGGVAGLVNTIRGAGEIYFDTLSVLVFLLLLGRYVQVRQQRHAAAAVEVLYRLTPRTAHRLVGHDGTTGTEGTLKDVPAAVLEPGDVVEVRAGETVPADGTLLSGRSAVDQKVLTGESQPVTVEPGATVAAGTLNLSASMRVRVDAVGADTRMGRILSLVEQSAEARPRIVQLADRLGGWFVVVVMVAAAGTLVGWLGRDPTAAVDHAVALLIVACPCALALATPLAISVALGRAARREILVKGGDVLQRLAEPGVLWLDKTGTLTEGRMSVLAWHGDREIRPWVAALERHASHPVARALVEHVEGDDLDPNEAETREVHDVRQSARGGIEGRFVDHRGEHVLRIGNAPFVREHLDRDTALPRVMLDRAMALVERAASPVFVMVDDRVVAVAGVGDALRPEAPAAVARLQAQGWTVGILSGDHPDIVAHVGRSLGLPVARCHGGLSPEDKVAFVHDDGRGPPVVMVGDGVNDSAALAAASVGIAVHDGAEASLEAAPVYLGRPGLRGLLQLLDGSRATMRAIRRNFGVSLAYNAVSIGLAAAGIINPLIAAILMPLSSLTVVGLSLSLRWEASS